ncbi:MAG TPA: AMP-binding protein [Terriglobia bacterium]|nr:AMP-binding protein [Terriglobia bacterium]
MNSESGATRKLSYAHGAGGPPLWGCTIGEALDRAAVLHPDRPALISRHQRLRYSYREFLAEVERAARGFLHLGVRKGDRVGVWTTNYAEWVITQFATAKIGAILVTVNPSYRAVELEYALKQSECSTLVLMQGFRDCDYVETLARVCPEFTSSAPGGLLSQRLPDLRNVIFVGGPVPAAGPRMLPWDDLIEMGRREPPERLREREAALDFDDPINIQYTSGTTGFPKGAMLSHHNIVNNGLLVGSCMKFTCHDRLAIPVPFYHCFGMVLGNMVCVTAGAAMILPAPHFNALATLEAVEAERCTALHGVPTMFIAELEHPEFQRFDLSTLRTGIMAGSPCPIEVMKRVVNEMHCAGLTIAYGLTETSPVVTQTTTEDPIELRVATVGKPLPHTEIKILSPEGRIVPRGEPGELCARGYMVMKGYYNNPAASRGAIDQAGWLHSGDMATMDESGYCRITGRVKDMICRGGENIYPREIEEFLYSHPAVSDVQVIGVPDCKYVEQVAAWIKLKDGAVCDADGIRSFCKGRIADFKVPRYVKFVDSFPMTVTGKIQKYKMREASIQEWGLEAAAKIETA